MSLAELEVCESTCAPHLTHGVNWYLTFFWTALLLVMIALAWRGRHQNGR